MFHEEKLINGIWHYRLTSRGHWRQMSYTQLNDKVSELILQLYKKEKKK